MTGTNFASGMTFALSPTVSGAIAGNLSGNTFQITGVFSTPGSYSVTVTVSSQTSTAATFVVSTPATATLSGRVFETAPTTSTAVAGATVTLADGPAAGRTTTTASDGSYSFVGIATGNMNVAVSKAGYDSTAGGVGLTSDKTLNFNLNPSAVTLSDTLTGTIDGGTSTCSDGIFVKPCRTITIPVHNTGLLDSTLTWSNSSDLDLTLFQGSTVIASSRGVGSTERISATLTKGLTYQLRITYYSGSQVTSYTLVYSRPQ